jgi:Mn-containing catalase
MAHVEMIATMVHQLMENATIDELKKAGLGGNYADHRKALFYTDATGNPCPIKLRHFEKNTQLVLNLPSYLALKTIQM